MDASKRPKIKEILQWPEIDSRISTYIQGHACKIEFARTFMQGDARFADFQATDEERKTTSDAAVDQSASEKLLKDEGF